jgi:hypothetical protein
MSTDTSGEPAPSHPPRKLSIEVQGFRAHRSGTLCGFATLFIRELSLRIIDCPVHQKNESRWVGLPGKPQLDRDGNVRRDERGKALYSAVMEITRREVRDAFSARAIEALLERFPLAFDEAAA